MHYPGNWIHSFPQNFQWSNAALVCKGMAPYGAVALMAYSAGGYYAPRAAAFEPRYAACVAWGPHYDYHAVWQQRWAAMKADHNSVATSHFQLPWVLGTPDMDSAMETVKRFTLEGVADKIKSRF